MKKLSHELLKTRRHHNNKGLHQIKNGGVEVQVKKMAMRLGVSYAKSRDRDKSL